MDNNNNDLHQRISMLEKSTGEHEVRIRDLEQNQAVNTERYANISKRLDKIDSHTAWLIRLLFGAICLTILNWILGGGLAALIGAGYGTP